MHAATRQTSGDAPALVGVRVGRQTYGVSALRALIFATLIGALAAACGGGDNNGTLSPTPNRSATRTAAPSGSATSHPDGLPAGRVTFYGADDGDQASSIVSGDFNGDGTTDVALGAASADGPNNTRADAGEVYFFYGPFAPGESLNAGAHDYDAIFYGATAGDTFGRMLLAADFDGDGVDDIAMSSPAAQSGAGAVYIMFGGALAAQTDFANDSPDVLITGADANDFAGYTLAAAHVDGDAKSDLIVGAMLADGPQDSRADGGEVYMLPGSSIAAEPSINLSQITDVIYGARAGDRLGEGLATGDVTGDGKPDLVLVATFSGGPDGSRAGAGQTYVVSTPATFPIDLATSDTPVLEVEGADAGDQLGHSVGVGDVDGDGANDLWLGAVSADGPANGVDLAGEAVLVNGKSGPVIDAAIANQPEAIIYGPELEARMGRALAVGDLNGDARADLAISAPNLDGRAGRVFVFDGGGKYAGDATGASKTLLGLDPGDTLGHEAFGMPPISIADADGDGKPDMLLSAAGGDGPNNDRKDSGEAYIIPGADFAG
jgi:hypothetical protein